MKLAWDVQAVGDVPPQSARSFTPMERDTTVDVEVGVDEELLEESELAAERAEGELRRRHPAELAGLVAEGRRAGRGRKIDGGARVTRSRSVVDSVGEVGVQAERVGREAAEDADAEPVEQVVLQPTREEDRALGTLVQQREATAERELRAAFTVQTLVTHGGLTDEGTGELDWACASEGAATTAPSAIASPRMHRPATLRFIEFVPVVRGFLRGEVISGNLYSQLNGRKMLMPI